MTVRSYTIADLQRRAAQRLPRIVSDFIDGGAQNEVTLDANLRAFQQLGLRSRVLTGVQVPDLSTTVLGQSVALPVLLAPVGLAGLVAPKGDLIARSAADRCETIYCLSTNSSSSIEEVAAVSRTPFWFQVYVMKDRGLTREMVERAAASGCSALVVTVDLPAQGRRLRDMRNGLTVPISVGARTLIDLCRHPRWTLAQLRSPARFANFEGPSKGSRLQIAAFISSQFDGSCTWRDVEWLQSIFRGPVVVKGLLEPDDVRMAASCGARAVVISNHGGRQLDGTRATLAALESAVDVAQGGTEVLLDGGVRSGGDVVKAVALGARAVFVGRPVLWGLAAHGALGVDMALSILREELANALTLMGVASISTVRRDDVFERSSKRRPC